MPAKKKKKRQVTKVIDEVSKIKMFHKELDSFALQLPGGRNDIKFSNNEVLKNFMWKQYPDWKNPGQVTSIPIGRVPRIFLQGDQMTQELEEKFASIQKGETGEIKVYNLLMESICEHGCGNMSGNTSQCGMLVLPNVDGNHFKTDIAHVEIDTVIVHPKIGVFVLNIKNTTRVNESGLLSDMEKHTRYIRLIRDYSGSDKLCGNNCGHTKVPVHGIICSFFAKVSETILLRDGYWSSVDEWEKRFVFQPEDMQNFSAKWKSILSSMPKVDICANEFEALISRLSVLNSLEGGLALLHDRIASNAIHSRDLENREDILVKNLKDASGNDQENIDLLKNDFLLAQDEKQEPPAKKKPLILWTKEQLEIIWNVSKALLQPSVNPCRMVVSGPKGSGKTMLLIYIAQLAKQIFRSQKNKNRDYPGNIAIYDGRFGSSLTLFEHLEVKLQGSEIDVKRSGMQDRPSVLFRRQLIIFDESISMWEHYLSLVLNTVKRHQHVILFSSEKSLVQTIQEKYPSYKKYQLTTALRSTGAITRFNEKFRSFDPASNTFSCKISHNLEGEPPEIHVVDINTQKDPEQLTYVTDAVNTIVQCAEQARGLKEMLVAPFVHPIVLQRVIVQLYKKGFDYEYRNPAESQSMSVPHDEILKRKPTKNNPNQSVTGHEDLLPLPLITFVTGNHVDGSEYGATVVLIERTLPHFWDGFIFDSLFISFTRTTTKLSVLVNNTDVPPIITESTKTENEDSMPLKWKTLSKPSDVVVYAYKFIKTPISLYSEVLMEIIIESRWQWNPVLVLGELPPGLDLTEISRSTFNETYSKNTKRRHEQQKCCEKTKWFQVDHLDDKHLISSPDFTSLDCHLGYDSIHDNSVKPSAIVFLVYNPTEYYTELEQINRHALLFMMYEKHMGNCPIYIVSPFPFEMLSFRLNSASICDRLSHEFRFLATCDEDIEEPAHESTVDPVSWDDLREKGNSCFRIKDLKQSLWFYKKSLDTLMAQYKESLEKPGIDIDMMINWQCVISKIYTNISRVLFEEGNMGTVGTIQIEKIELSLQYSELAVKMNPFWYKGYHRMSKAYEYLGDKENSLKMREKMMKLDRFDQSRRKVILRSNLLKDVLQNSISWELVRFKDNAYLVDVNGHGHYNSISQALKDTDYHGPVSLVVNPGLYETDYPLSMLNRQVDIVGNWEQHICAENKWIVEDPPIVIQDIPHDNSPFYNTINVGCATVFLSRVSIYNWQTHTTHAVSGLSSNITLSECSFNSQCGVAVAVNTNSSLSIIGCRSVGAFSSVLARNNNDIDIKNSFISRTARIGVELSQEVRACIEGCTFSYCEGAGLGMKQGRLVMDLCTFESNTTRASADEGSIQLRYVHAVISRSLIQYQLGNGIVMEFGDGSFNGLKIDRCQNAGLLVQSPITIQDCRITNCRYGISVCRMIFGVLKMRDNDILRCRFAVYRKPGASSPEINGVISRCSNDEAGYDMDDPYWILQEEIGHGRKCYKSRWMMILGLREASKYNVLDSVLTAGIKGFRGCEYCTVIDYSGRSIQDFIFCDLCGCVYYCSRECFEKDKKYHKIICDWMVRDMKRYLESLRLKNTHGEANRYAHRHNSASRLEKTSTTTVVTKPRKKKKQRSQWKKKKSANWQ